MREDALRSLEAVARELDAPAIAYEAHALAERAAEGRFFVACVGQFKRGKSTLLNALVASDILPTGTVPVTSVVTVLRYGETGSARLRRRGDAGWQQIDPADLAEYVSEERNPGNAKGVVAVEVFLPSDLLASGLCFVDTPGLGSVFSANSDATREFVPHIDAALVVFGADPPISGEEAGIAAEIAREVEAFIFVINKVDRVTERECEEALSFAKRVLSERLSLPVERVFRVSALEVASGRGARDWAALDCHLRTLAERSGQTLVETAVHRGVARLAARLQNILAEERAALERPLIETEERVRVLRQASEEASRALWELSPLFSAEMERLSGVFERRRAAFIRVTLPECGASLHEVILACPVRFGPALRSCALHTSQEIARQHVLPWLHDSELEAASEYRAATSRLADLVNGLLDRLRTSDAWATVPLPTQVQPDTAVRGRSRFRFDTFAHVESPAGIVPAAEWVADAMLPRRMNCRRVERAAAAYLARLVTANAHRVENSIKQRLQDSRLQMESEIRVALKEVLHAAEQGMERAQAVQAEGQDAVDAALARLDRLQRQVRDLLAGCPSGQA